MLEIIDTKKEELRRDVDALRTCPNCLYNTKVYARLHGLDQWKLESQCACGYTRDDYEWPFMQEPTLQAVKPGEFEDFDILLHRNLDPLNESWVDDMEEEYNDEVAHGWERSHDDF